MGQRTDPCVQIFLRIFLYKRNIETNLPDHSSYQRRSKQKQTMKKLIALAVVAIASQVVSASAGEAVASSKEVAAPAPPPPPASYFRSNEFSLGLFGSYGWTYNNNTRGIGNHAWGGGIDGQYFPLQYLGFAIEGDFFNEVPGDFFGSTVTGNVILRYPLDINFPGLHLAPYAFGGVGGLFNQNNTFTRIVTLGHAQDTESQK